MQQLFAYHMDSLSWVGSDTEHQQCSPGHHWRRGQLGPFEVGEGLKIPQQLWEQEVVKYNTKLICVDTLLESC